MGLKLNPEQIAYLKSLDSKKKKRNFILDQMVEEIEFEEKPISRKDFLKNQIRFKWEYLIEPDKLEDTLSNEEKVDLEVPFAIEIQNFLKSKNLDLELNEIQDLEKIFLKYHDYAKINNIEVDLTQSEKALEFDLPKKDDDGSYTLYVKTNTLLNDSNLNKISEFIASLK